MVMCCSAKVVSGRRDRLVGDGYLLIMEKVVGSSYLLPGDSGEWYVMVMCC